MRQATGRDALLKRILALIRGNAAQTDPPNQHLLVLGPRGMGKSFLVRMVEVQVQAMADAGAPVVFVRLPEEQLNVSTPELLLDEIRRVLERRPPEEVRVRWRAGSEAEWHNALTSLCGSVIGEANRAIEPAEGPVRRRTGARGWAACRRRLPHPGGGVTIIEHTPRHRPS